MCYAGKLSLAGEVFQNLTADQIQSSLQYDPGNRLVIREVSGYSKFAIWTWFVIWVSAFELYLSFASLRQSASPRLAKTNGNPTKRIIRILTTKSAAGSHLTYEKELLNSRKNSNFHKTNHPGFPHGLPPMTQITTSFAYMPRMTLLSFPRSFYLLVTKSKVRYSSLTGVTRW
jgi:hypothetical protein